MDRVPRSVRVSARVRGKAEEYMRLLRAKSCFFGKAEICKPMACVCIAADILHEDVDTRAIMRMGGVPKALFDSTVQRIRAALHIRADVSAAQLGVQLGCNALVPHAVRIAAAHTRAATAEQRDARVPRPVAEAAALWLCARAHGTRMARADVLRLSGVAGGELDRMAAAMRRTCAAELDKVPTKSGRQGKGKKAARAGDADGGEGSAGAVEGKGKGKGSSLAELVQRGVDAESDGSDDDGGDESGADSDVPSPPAAKRRRATSPHSAQDTGASLAPPAAAAAAAASGGEEARSAQYEKWRASLMRASTSTTARTHLADSLLRSLTGPK